MIVETSGLTIGRKVSHGGELVRFNSKRLGRLLSRNAATMDRSKLAEQPLRARSVEELCSLWDAEFVDAAYQTLLHRTADPDGRAHLLKRIRAGQAKLSLVYDLCRSPEGRSVQRNVAGLQGALQRAAISKLPVLSLGYRLLGHELGNSRSAVRQRRTDNALERAIREVNILRAHTASLSATTERLRERVNNLYAAQETLSDERRLPLTVERILEMAA